MSLNSSNVPFFFKDPDANKDYDFDWTDWMPTGDSISSSTVEAEDGITLGSKQQGNYIAGVWTPSASGSIIKQFISGGDALQDYRVTCRISTIQSRIDDRTMTIKVREQ